MPGGSVLRGNQHFGGFRCSQKVQADGKSIRLSSSYHSLLPITDLDWLCLGAKNCFCHVVEPYLYSSPVRHVSIKCPVEVRTVIVVKEVAQLVEKYIVYALTWGLHQQGIQCDTAQG